MADLPIFPTHRLNPDSVTPKIVNRTVSGGVSLSGAEDVIQTDGGGRIEVTYGDMPIDDPQAERIINAWDAFLGGGTETFLLPLVTLRTAPRPFAGDVPANVPAFGDNDPIFPTKAGYRFRLIEASLLGAVALRATSATIRISRGSPILGGEWFSINGEAHRIMRVTSRAGMDATVVVNPPFRAAQPNGAPVEFEWPVMKARLQPGTDLSAAMTYGLYGDLGATFQEVI